MSPIYIYRAMECDIINAPEVLKYPFQANTQDIRRPLLSYKEMFIHLIPHSV